MPDLDLIRHNFIAKATHFARLIPGMSVQETLSFVRVDCGLPSDTFNSTVLKTADFNAAKAVLAYYQNKNFPAAFWVFESPDAAETIQYLIDLQLVTNETNIAMWADLKTLPSIYETKSECEIQLACTPVEVAAHGNALANLFEPFAEAAQIRKYYHSILPYYEAPTSPIQFFIGMYKGEVVSTGTLFFDQNSAGIYDIATQVNARKKGFGSQMFHYLLQTIKDKGITTAILQASPDGLSIYKKAGFQEAGVVKVFENRHLLK